MKVFGNRHLVCDGDPNLNGTYVEAGYGPDLEPLMYGVDPEIAKHYELEQWPTSEWVWMHKGVKVIEFLRDAVNDAEVN